MKINYKRMTHILGAALVLSLLVTIVVLAGSIDSPAAPTDSASQMYTLEQVYDRVDDGTSATKMGSFTEPSSGPGSTMYTLTNLYDLVSERARVPKTGQTTSYATGDDGDHEKGVAWPSPRFTDNSDGTVTDNLTGLIWLKNANCYGGKTWANALLAANGLANGSCGLTDSSSAGDWRLPNVQEMLSLIDYGQNSPALPSGHPFSNVVSNEYWSSTTLWSNTDQARAVGVSGDGVVLHPKSQGYYLWPVRGGQ